MEIRLLTEETISRIAAGEVIERPLNVVKELVENSIDAGATAIDVEIRDGGIQMVRVTDNGCGIARDQIGKAFIRHATSKITEADDLSRLSSLGFRGEALASIAAVAQVEMVTKVREAIAGTRAVNDHLAAYSPDAPVRIDLEEIGAPDGTTVIVRNLFGSIPVRRRFLRQPQTEAGYITDLIEKQALSHPGISFHYRVNGQEKIHTSGNGNLRELIYRIYGREVAAAILPVQARDEGRGMALDGFLGKPEISRASRSFETFFINGRMLHSKELSAGLEEGYRTDLMQHRFPFAVLHLSMPQDQVDVNVHPSKMEVRFTDRRAVFDFLNQSVYDALRQIERIPRASLQTAREEREAKRKEARHKEDRLRDAPRLEAFESGRAPAPQSLGGGQASQAFGGGRPSQAFGGGQEPQAQGERQLSAAPPAAAGQEFALEDRRAGAEATDLIQEEGGWGQAAIPAARQIMAGFGQQTMFPAEPQNPALLDRASLLTPENAAHFRYVGQVFGTYWIIEYEKKLLIIDQHAAHEKVNYERIMRRIGAQHPGLEAEAGEKMPREASIEEYMDKCLANSAQFAEGEKGEGTGESGGNAPVPSMAGGALGHGPILVASQQLMPPTVLRLSGREEAAYRQFRAVFAAMGYEIEDFGAGSYAIRAVPTELFGQSADRLLREILEEIMGERISGTPHAIIAKIASMSCKAAVKGNRKLSEAEARALIGELLSLENPYHCPHGRPTMIVMDQHEMDRKFKRIV